MTTTTETIAIRAEPEASTPVHSSKSEPLQLRGALDGFKSFDVTPVIGREFPDADLKEWLEAPNSDELLRDLAVTSKRLRAFMPPAQLIGPSIAAWSRVLQEAR